MQSGDVLFHISGCMVIFFMKPLAKHKLVLGLGKNMVWSN